MPSAFFKVASVPWAPTAKDTTKTRRKKFFIKYRLHINRGQKQGPTVDRLGLLEPLLKLRMHKVVVFLLVLISNVAVAGPVTEKMPPCVRPSDFANGKFVASYFTCLKRQDEFCRIHREDKTCAARPVNPGKPYFKTTVDDIDPQVRCKI